jgi:hypothetical protein
MILRLLATASLALFVVTAPAFAAKGNKGKKGAKPGRVLSRFDRDHNGAIDGQEVARVQAAFASLTALDTDNNGQLSEAEITAAKVPVRKKGARKSPATAPVEKPAPAPAPANSTPTPQ